MIKNESLFGLIDELQQIHGLRMDDYVRYRRYCTRKLERLRSKFNLHHTAKSQVKVSLELCKNNPEALHLILFKCEWFWSEINQLRRELSNNSRKKHHLRSVCLNSRKYLQELRTLSQESLEMGSNLRLEYLAYVNFIEGIVGNELKEFSVAFNSLQRAKFIIEELMQRNCNVLVLESKLAEIETFLRICQYSADMYDVIIEADEEDLDEIKISHLTEKLSKSEIKETAVQQTLKIGSKTFKLSPINLDTPTIENLQIARKILKNQVPDTVEYENAHLQVLYFENRFYGKLIRKQITRKLFKSDFKNEKVFYNLLKKILNSKGYKAEDTVSRGFDLTASFLDCLSNICDGLRSQNDVQVSKDASNALKIIEIIEKEFDLMKANKVKPVLSLKIVMNKFIKKLRSLVGKPIVYSVIDAAPVPPKPSFYDMAFDCLNYERIPSQQSQSQSQSHNQTQSSTFSNLLSSFWGKK